MLFQSPTSYYYNTTQCFQVIYEVEVLEANEEEDLETKSYTVREHIGWVLAADFVLELRLIYVYLLYFLAIINEKEAISGMSEMSTTWPYNCIDVRWSIWTTLIPTSAMLEKMNKLR